MKAKIPKHYRFIDLNGKRFGRLEVIEYAGRHQSPSGSYTLWTCLCDCGNTVTTASKSLRNGIAKSCGCFRSDDAAMRHTTHGMTRSPEFSSWQAMRARCQRPSHTYYKDYGGRGITICERWESFEAFLADMGPRPSLKHQIERIDNNGNYEPSNCHWIEAFQQGRNKRNNRLLSYRGETLHIAEWSRRTGLSRETIWHRLKIGWSVEKAITTPITRRRNVLFH